MAFLFKSKKQAWGLLGEIFERKPIKAFAWQIPAFGALAPALQAAFQPFLLPQDPIRMILFAPAQSVLAERQDLPPGWPKGLLPWRITPEHTLILTASRLLVVAAARRKGGSNEVPLIGEDPPAAPVKEEQPLPVQVIPFNEILYLQSVSILLFSWFEVAWVNAGRLEHLRVHFNTVSRHLFEDLTESLRLALPEQARVQPQADRRLELLAGMPYKFRSLIPLRLLPGEPIQAALFRPSIWRKKALVFKTQLAPKLALVRTPAYLVIVQEDLTQQEDSYGLISLFCPLANLSRSRLEPGPTEVDLVLTLCLHGAEHELRLPFPAGEQPELQAFLSVA